MNPRYMTPAAFIAAALGLCGCGSATMKSSAYQSAPCVELDDAIGSNSREISATAIRRGQVDSWQPPFWMAGAKKGAAAVHNKQTRKIERLQEQGERMTGERARRCRSYGAG